MKKLGAISQFRRRAIAAAVISATALIVVTAGAIVAVNEPTQCAPLTAARVDVPEEPGDVQPITAEVKCPPDSGREYALILELPVVDSPENPHPEYYRLSKEEPLTVGIHTYQNSISGFDMGGKSCIYVMSFSPFDAVVMRQNTTSGGGKTVLPEGARLESNKVCSRRTS